MRDIVAYLKAIISLLLLNAHQIPTDGEFYVGVGEGPDLDQARAAAMANLVQQIQVFVSSSFSSTIAESNDRHEQLAVQRVIARSAVELRGVEESVERLSDDHFRVTKTIAKESVRAMFRERRTRILELAALAEEELEAPGAPQVNVGSALKHLYWAGLLAQIYPDTLTYRGYSIGLWIPKKLESVMRDIQVQPVKQIDDRPVTWSCQVRWGGRLVSSLSYNFFDGYGTTLGDVREGKTAISLYFPDTAPRGRTVHLEVDYWARDEMDELLGLADSLQRFRKVPNEVIVAFAGSGEVRRPGQRDPSPPALAGGGIPAVLEPLVRARNSPSDVRKELEALQKRSKAVLGVREDFETLEGLYVAVVDGYAGMVALLRHRNGNLEDAATGVQIAKGAYSGKRWVWIELH